MWVNSSSYGSIFQQMQKCYDSAVGPLNITSIAVTSAVLLLPLCVLVLLLALRRRRRRSSAAISHSDFFTFHIIGGELINVSGYIVACCGVHAAVPPVTTLGMHLYSVNVFGQMFFQVLTCVERYLAVVHPVTYLSLRNAKAVRLRNATVAAVWLLSFGGTGLMSAEDHVPVILLYFGTIAVVLAVVSFCSVAVLCALIRPAPGDGGEARRRVDRSKLTAFHTIVAILGVLVLRFGGGLLGTALYSLPQLETSERCGAWISVAWFGFPSSLLSPLLFLHRAKNLLSCTTNGPGRGSD